MCTRFLESFILRGVGGAEDPARSVSLGRGWIASLPSLTVFLKPHPSFLYLEGGGSQRYKWVCVGDHPASRACEGLPIPSLLIKDHGGRGVLKTQLEVAFKRGNALFDAEQDKYERSKCTMSENELRQLASDLRKSNPEFQTLRSQVA